MHVTKLIRRVAMHHIDCDWRVDADTVIYQAVQLDIKVFYNDVWRIVNMMKIAMKLRLSPAILWFGALACCFVEMKILLLCYC